jgi:hypothetical protein
MKANESIVKFNDGQIAQNNKILDGGLASKKKRLLPRMPRGLKRMPLAQSRSRAMLKLIQKRWMR